MTRPNVLEDFIDSYAKAFNISQSLQDASGHLKPCKCEKCLDWWIEMGADEDGKFGPFTAEEIAEAKRKK